MVCSRVDIRLKHNAVLRGHLPGFECDAEAIAVLDEFCVQHGVCGGNGVEMAGLRFHKILHQLLDHSRFYHCLCKCSHCFLRLFLAKYLNVNIIWSKTGISLLIAHRRE